VIPTILHPRVSWSWSRVDNGPTCIKREKKIERSRTQTNVGVSFLERRGGSLVLRIPLYACKSTGNGVETNAKQRRERGKCIRLLSLKAHVRQ